MFKSIFFNLNASSAD